MEAPSSFHDMMGFSSEVMYEDDAGDSSIPDIQKITKRNNVLPIHGSPTTMNLNHLVLENIVQSNYTKNILCEVTTFQQATEHIFYDVSHLEPWERGTRRLQGMSGMCGGVRGVGAGGVISSAFCLLYKLFTLRLTRKQLVAMINSTQSVYIRGIGFMYVRYTQPPADLWPWFSPYLEDEEEIDPQSGGGGKMTIAQMVRTMLTKLDWHGTLFPRIPIPLQKDIDQKLKEIGRSYQREAGPGDYDDSKQRAVNEDANRGNGHDRDGQHAHSHRSREEHGSLSRRPKRCGHHLRHHHCPKHRKRCPSKAKKARQEHENPRVDHEAGNSKSTEERKD